MPTQQQTPIPLLVLNDAMREDYRSTVVKRALDALNQVSPQARQWLRAEIRQHVRIPGFADATRALNSPKRPGLVNEIIRVSHLSPKLMGAILRTWAESLPELHQTVSEFLRLQGEPVLEPSQIEDAFPSAWSPEAMFAATEAFLQEHPSFERDDVALMLCYISGRAPVPEEPLENSMSPQISSNRTEDSQTDSAGQQPEHLQTGAADQMTEPEPVQIASSLEDSNVSELPSTFQDILSHLQSLPPDAGEWDRIASLIDAIRSLTESKLAERNQGREQLRQALLALKQEAGDALRWWEYDCDSWSAEVPPWHQTLALAGRILQWQGELLEHARLRQTPTSSRAEEQSRRAALDDLESRIQHGFVELDAALRPGQPGPTTPHEEEVSAPPSAEETRQDEGPSPEAGSLPVMSPTESVVPTESEIEIEEEALEEAIIPPTDIREAPSDEAGSFDMQQPAATLTGDVVAMVPEEALPGISSEFASRPAHMPEGKVLPEAPSEEERITVPLSETDVAWHELLWTMVAEDDLAGACWLTRSLDAMGRPTPVPDWLLAAVLGSRFVSADTPGLARDLLQIANTHTLRDLGPACELLFAAAALYPVLVAPYTGMVEWLNIPSICPGLSELVEAVRSFGNLGFGLHPEDAMGAAGDEQRAEAIAAASREAQNWLEQAARRRERVTGVWHGLVGPRGKLRELLRPVCENRQEEVDGVRAALRSWKERRAVYKRFDEMNASTSTGRPERVTGAGKQDLYREVERAVELAERWCDLVERARAIEARGDWFRRQVMQLREQVEKTLPGIEASLSELTMAAPQDVKSSAQALRKSLDQLCVLLNLTTTDDRPTLASLPLRDLALDPDSLDAILVGRLLYLPEVELDDAGRPTSSGLLTVASALQSAHQEGRTLEAAIRLWLAQEDYRFFDRMLAPIFTQDTINGLRQRFDEALNDSRAKLRESINAISTMVEQALLDNVIDDAKHADYAGRYASLAVEEVRNFKAKLADLEQIRSEIGQAYEQRLAYLTKQYQDISDRLKVPHIPPDRQQQVLAFIANALGSRDVRVAEETLTNLSEVLDSGGVLSEDWFAPEQTRDPLKEFIAGARGIEEWLEQTRSDMRSLADAAQKGATIAGIQFARLGEPRREEASKAFLAWRALKQSSGNGKVAAWVATVLRYLGFDLKTGDAGSINVERFGNDWWYARAEMSAASNLARPIPEFGSQAQGRYNIVCLWERPGAESIAARLNDLSLAIHPVSVFYLGRLTDRQKRELIRVSRDRKLAIALLDETLLVFLARERDNRLPAFLRCALPFSALNPYRPFLAGEVPPEMFFGRDDMARELQQPGGSCLVYGGRQLGKSALLRHVQRQFHNPARDQYAWVENMKLIYDPSADKGLENIWLHLREGFKAHRLISAHSFSDKPEEIRRQIRDALQANPGRRVIVMLDEADAFLDADARQGFGTVVKLRELMQATERRFKVIFAGLQNVQRFQGIPDQPLAHFGAPICVGPLDPEEAQQLVRQPLETLGYRFADDSDVLRILSFTNRHPGLIQYFCQELLEHLRNYAGSVSLPYTVRQEHIEAVYRKKDVRERIRERFEWTLALDMHYQAIAWSLIVDQAHDRDGYSRAYSPGHIMQLAREWWPAGFSNTTSDQFRGWLDEMCGLGVLMRNESTGQYRLRSPNMVRLLGKETDIEDRLLELGSKSPISVMEADSHHAPLDDKAAHYSPLTYAQERSLFQPRFGVGLVFASEALGWSGLLSAIRRVVAGLSSGQADCTFIPASMTDKELSDWLAGYLREHRKTERMILYREIRRGASGEMARLVEQALDFCQRQRAKDRWLRILFLFDPASTWQWLALSESERLRLEEAADAALWPRPWTQSAIRYRLEKRDMLDTNGTRTTAALEATGGWPYLLDVLFERCGEKTDLKPTADQMIKELNDPNSPLAGDFRSRLGLGHKIADQVLRFIMQEGKNGLEEELLQPELIEGDTQLTAAQCNQAREYLTRFGILRSEEQVLRVDPVVAKVLTAS